MRAGRFDVLDERASPRRRRRLRAHETRAHRDEEDERRRERVHELFQQTFPRFKEFEPQLRAAAQLSLEQWALERAGLLEEEPYRRGHRVRILQHAIAPLAPSLKPAVRDRLHRALSVVYGIEPYVILKDIWGLPDRQVESTALWMADALIDAALRESGVEPEPRGPKRRAVKKKLAPVIKLRSV